MKHLNVCHIGIRNAADGLIRGNSIRRQEILASAALGDNLGHALCAAKSCQRLIKVCAVENVREISDAVKLLGKDPFICRRKEGSSPVARSRLLEFIDAIEEDRNIWAAPIDQHRQE